MGFGVLQIDLFGCGDSSGDFSDARWDIWKQDIAAAREWLEERISAPVSLWGPAPGRAARPRFCQERKKKIGPYYSLAAGNQWRVFSDAVSAIAIG